MKPKTMEKQKKQQYIVPVVNAVDVVVESGFAQSSQGNPSNTVNASSMEDIQIDW